MTAQVPFRQANATRLIRAALMAGCPEETILVTVSPDGTLSLAVKRPTANDDERDDSWDDA